VLAANTTRGTTVKRLAMLIVLAACAAHAADEGPPKKERFEGGLSREEIQRTVVVVMPDIKGCYEAALNRDPNLAGRITLKWVIAGDGTVTTILIEKTTFADPMVENCVIGILRRQRFPTPKGGGIVNVTYPFVFSNSGADTPAQGSRGAAEVERVVQGAAGQLETCVALRPKPGLATSVDVYLKVTAGGETRDAWLTSKDLDSEASEACLIEKLKALRFPALARPDDTIVSYPLRFLPADAKPPAPAPARKTGSCGWPF